MTDLYDKWNASLVSIGNLSGIRDMSFALACFSISCLVASQWKLRKAKALSVDLLNTFSLIE